MALRFIQKNITLIVIFLLQVEILPIVVKQCFVSRKKFFGNEIEYQVAWIINAATCVGRPYTHVCDSDSPTLSGITRRFLVNIHIYISANVRSFANTFNRRKSSNHADVVYIHVKLMRNRKCVGRFASLSWHTYDFYASKNVPHRVFNCLHNRLLYGYYIYCTEVFSKHSPLI